MIIKMSITAFTAFLISQPSIAADRGFTNYDGDTFRATFRIANVDTPEIKGQCDFEVTLALKAKQFTDDFLHRGKVVITQTGTDRFGRVLVTVSRDGIDLGEALVDAGLAKPWRGRRERWC